MSIVEPKHDPTPEEVEQIRKREFAQGQITTTVYFLGKDVAEIKETIKKFNNDMFEKNGVVPRLEKVESFVRTRQSIEKYLLWPLTVIALAGMGGFLWLILIGRYRFVPVP